MFKIWRDDASYKGEKEELEKEALKISPWENKGVAGTLPVRLETYLIIADCGLYKGGWEKELIVFFIVIKI